MKPRLAAAILALPLLASTAAHAGVFVGLGLGTGSDLNDSARIAPDGRSERFQAGYAIPVGPGRFAIEGLYQRFDVNTTFDKTMGASSLGLAGRYNLPINNGFEVYGRLGVQRLAIATDSTAPSATSYNTQGQGPLFGGGFELRPSFKLGVDLSFWVDLTYVKASLIGDRYKSADASAHFFTAGVSVGF